MQTEIFKEFRRLGREKRKSDKFLIYYDDEINNCDGSIRIIDMIPSNENLEEKANLKIIFRNFWVTLNNKDKEIIKLLYLGHSQNEVAKKVNCSQPQVSRIKTRLRKYLLA